MGARAAHVATRGITLAQEATARAPESIVARLAKFFPDAAPVRMPVKLTRLMDRQDSVAESTVIEFATPREILFATAAPLEFAEKLRIRNSDSTLDAEASVVAVQYHNEKTAVAARFTREVANWIVKP
jgi:hypothetical protein